MRFWIQKTRFPSACASGFKAWALSQSCREAKCENRAARQRVVRNSIDWSVTCVSNRFDIHGPLPANAGDSKSTWATPKNAEGFRGCRSPLPAAADLNNSLLGRKLGDILAGPGRAVSDHPLGRTKPQEARGASRGNACLDSKNTVSLSLRFGLQSMGFVSLVLVQPRHQNLRQDRESYGAHSIATQLVC
jgi:hypothetical protein